MPYVEILTDDQAVKGYAYPIEVKVYSAGTQIVPTSATIDIYDPDSTAVITDGTVGVAVAGTMTYSLESTYLDTLWESARMEIDYVIATVHYKAVFFFDCVLNALKCSVIDADLKAYAPRLAAEIWSVQSPANYSVQILEAFSQVKRAIKDKGRRPHMLIDGAQVRELVILKALSMICFDLSRSTEDIWWARYLKLAEEYATAFSRLVVKYDSDESGDISSDEQGGNMSQPTLER